MRGFLVVVVLLGRTLSMEAQWLYSPNTGYPEDQRRQAEPRRTSAAYFRRQA